MGLFTKNSSWNAKQSIQHTTVTFMARLDPELWREKNWLLHHDNALSHISIFAKEFLTKNNVTVAPIHPTLLCFPD
jgi:hypothetical protein